MTLTERIKSEHLNLVCEAFANCDESMARNSTLHHDHQVPVKNEELGKVLDQGQWGTHLLLAFFNNNRVRNILFLFAQQYSRATI